MIRMPPGSRLCSVFHDLHCSKWFIIIAQLDLGKLASLSFYLVHFSSQLLCYNHNLNQNESNACHSTFFSEIMFLLWAIASDRFTCSWWNWTINDVNNLLTCCCVFLFQLLKHKSFKCAFTNRSNYISTWLKITSMHYI